MQKHAIAVTAGNNRNNGGRKIGTQRDLVSGNAMHVDISCR